MRRCGVGNLRSRMNFSKAPGEKPFRWQVSRADHHSYCSSITDKTEKSDKCPGCIKNAPFTLTLLIAGASVSATGKFGCKRHG